jgi:hypothetical protein
MVYATSISRATVPCGPSVAWLSRGNGCWRLVRRFYRLRNNWNDRPERNQDGDVLMAGAKWQDLSVNAKPVMTGSSDTAYGSGTLDEEVLRNNKGDTKAANKDGHVRGSAGGEADNCTKVLEKEWHGAPGRLARSAAARAHVSRLVEAERGSTKRAVAPLDMVFAC